MITDRMDDVRDTVASVVGTCLLAYPQREVPQGQYAVLTRPSSTPAVTTSKGEEVGTASIYTIRIHLPRDAGQRETMALASRVADELAALGCRRLGMSPMPSDATHGPAILLTVQQTTDGYYTIIR